MLNFLFLFVSLIVWLVSHTLISIWVSLLLSLLSTMCLFGSTNSDSSLKYIFVQEGSSWVLLSGVIFSNPTFMTVGLAFKLGIPPMHSWFLEIITKNTMMGPWLLGLSKMVPGFFLISLSSMPMLFFVLGSTILSNMMAVGGASFYPTMVYSSASNMSFFLLINFISFHSALTFFFLYCMFMYFMISPTSWDKDFSWENLSHLGGLPPSFIFFMKMTTVFMGGEWMALFLSFFLLSSAPQFFSYFRIWESKTLLLSVSLASPHSRNISFVSFFFVFVPFLLYFF